jgi:hypothetical protein
LKEEVRPSTSPKSRVLSCSNTYKGKSLKVCDFEILYVFQNEINHSESNTAETKIQIWSNVEKMQEYIVTFDFLLN